MDFIFEPFKFTEKIEREVQGVPVQALTLPTHPFSRLSALFCFVSDISHGCAAFVADDKAKLIRYCRALSPRLTRRLPPGVPRSEFGQMCEDAGPPSGYQTKQ